MDTKLNKFKALYYKGTLDISQEPPEALEGWLYRVVVGNGLQNYFSFIEDMQAGDTIIYTGKNWELVKNERTVVAGSGITITTGGDLYFDYKNDNLYQKQSEESDEEKLEKLLKPSSEDFWGI